MTKGIRCWGLGALLLAALGLSGCATAPQAGSFTVYLSSLAAPKAAQLRSYVLVPAMDGVDDNDLQFLEYAGYAHRVLQARGFELAHDPDEATVLVGLAYGISDPQTELYSYAVPTWGRTGTASATTYGNTTYFTPSYGITGYVPQTGTYTTYRRQVWIAGYDLTTEEPRQVWETIIHSTGWSNDLRRVFPVMLAAAEDAVATNTGRQVETVIEEHDVRVLRLKGEY